MSMLFLDVVGVREYYNYIHDVNCTHKHDATMIIAYHPLTLRKWNSVLQFAVLCSDGQEGVFVGPA
jgi:hypothetical protein